MNKHAQQIVDSIIEEFAVGVARDDDLAAKSLFRLLNFCPPPEMTPLENDQDRAERLKLRSP